MSMLCRPSHQPLTRQQLSWIVDCVCHLYTYASVSVIHRYIVNSTCAYICGVMENKSKDKTFVL